MDPDPLQPIADRLVPLVSGRLEWWREVVVRWASDPPQHLVEPTTEQFQVNCEELRDIWRRRSEKQPRRSKDESDDNWKHRRALALLTRKHYKRLLAKAQHLDDGCPIYNDKVFQIIPVPFPKAKLTSDERVSLLAAIYDDCVPGETRIDPWSVYLEPGGAQKEELSERASVWWVLVTQRVPSLREHWHSHRAMVEMFLGEVERQFASTDITERLCRGSGKPRAQTKRRGRRTDTDCDEDRRIFEAWGTGQYKTLRELARELGEGKTAKDVKRAIDRHRKRVSRSHAE